MPLAVCSPPPSSRKKRKNDQEKIEKNEKASNELIEYGTDGVGAILGRNATGALILVDCTNYASIIADEKAGGIVGISYGRIELSFCGESTIPPA